MKSSINFFAIIGLLFAFSLATSAQVNSDHQLRTHERQNPAERAKIQTAEMVRDLQLDDDQSTRIGELNLSYAERMQEAQLNGTTNDRKAMMEARTKLETDRSTELRGILTEEQYTNYETMQAKRRDSREGNSGKIMKKSDRPNRSDNK